MEKNSDCLESLEQLRMQLNGRVLILGIGNTLRSDDGLGSILVKRIKDKVSYIVYDSNISPENYLGKIIKDNPDIVLMVDAVDFGGHPGDFKVFKGEEIEKLNFFSTHNSSLSLAIDYLKKSIKARIMILAVQPKVLVFGENLSPEVNKTLDILTGWFLNGKV